MEKQTSLKKYVIAGGTVALLAGTITLSVARAGKASASTYANVNTSSNPIPVSLNAPPGPTVQAQQSGTWNVGINGTPTVIVGNSAQNPLFVRDVDESGRIPFQISQNVSFGVVSFTAFLPIPDGKIAVIEHVSTSGGLQGTGPVQGFVRCFNGTQEVNHSLVLTQQGVNEANGFTFYAASQPIKCYASGGPDHLSIHVQTGNFQNAQPIWVAAASGYLVNQ